MKSNWSWFLVLLFGSILGEAGLHGWLIDVIVLVPTFVLFARALRWLVQRWRGRRQSAPTGDAP